MQKQSHRQNKANEKDDGAKMGHGGGTWARRKKGNQKGGPCSHWWRKRDASREDLQQSSPGNPTIAPVPEGSCRGRLENVSKKISLKMTPRWPRSVPGCGTQCVWTCATFGVSVAIWGSLSHRNYDIFLNFRVEVDHDLLQEDALIYEESENSIFRKPAFSQFFAISRLASPHNQLGTPFGTRSMFCTLAPSAAEL